MHPRRRRRRGVRVHRRGAGRAPASPSTPIRHCPPATIGEWQLRLLRAGIRRRAQGHRADRPGGTAEYARARLTSHAGQVTACPAAIRTTCHDPIIAPRVHDLGGFQVRRAVPSLQARSVGAVRVRRPHGAGGVRARARHRRAPASAHRPGDGDVPVVGHDRAPRHARQRPGHQPRRRQLDDGRSRHRPFRTHAGARCARASTRCTACRPGSPCPGPTRRPRRRSTTTRRRPCRSCAATARGCASSPAAATARNRRCGCSPTRSTSRSTSNAGAELALEDSHAERALYLLEGQAQLDGADLPEKHLVRTRPRHPPAPARR